MRKKSLRSATGIQNHNLWFFFSCPARVAKIQKRIIAQKRFGSDESCIIETDVAKCAGYFHGVNVKLTKCGGLTPARRMIAEAKALSMKTMVGCMNESSVGISAIAHLLPLLDYVDMDGTLLIANDPATGVTFDFGKVLFANENGTGASLLQH